VLILLQLGGQRLVVGGVAHLGSGHGHYLEFALVADLRRAELGACLILRLVGFTSTES